jgi:hypothetical protein
VRYHLIRLLPAALSVLSICAPSIAHAAACKSVQGYLIETESPSCTSPVGLCTDGQIFGQVQGVGSPIVWKIK